MKLLTGIGKQGRQTVDNQSRSVLQPFINQFVNQNNGVNDTCQINKRTLCTSMTRVLMAIRGLSSCRSCRSITVACAQRSAPLNDFAYFAFNFNDINFFRLTGF